MPIGPEGHAAMDKAMVGRCRPFEGFRVIEPARCTALRVNGRHLAEGGAGISTPPTINGVVS